MAFIIPQGLFEFCAMPFGLTNAPSVFQCLMNQVLMGLNPANRPDFVTVYINDVSIFSKTLEDHLSHLHQVLQRLQQVGLKLKPEKCEFFCEEMEYLGYMITPLGLQTNQRLVTAVKEFSCPKSVTDLKQFLGMSSYYWRFIQGYACLAHPLCALTRKDAKFEWNDDFQVAFDALKE